MEKNYQRAGQEMGGSHQVPTLRRQGACPHCDLRRLEEQYHGRGDIFVVFVVGGLEVDWVPNRVFFCSLCSFLEA